jgi:hypothetical protein
MQLANDALSNEHSRLRQPLYMSMITYLITLVSLRHRKPLLKHLIISFYQNWMIHCTKTYIDNNLKLYADG